MSGKIITILALIIGIMILGAGLYYWMQEKDDKESQKIYTITAVIGALIVIGTAAKIIMLGL